MGFKHTRIFCSAAIALVGATFTIAASPGPQPVCIRSRSGQFAVTGLPATHLMGSYGRPTNSSYLRLDPTVVAVSCEKVKEALLGELKAEESSKSTIYVSLYPVTGDNEPVIVTSVKYLNGWSYHLELPEILAQKQFTKAVVQVLLMELANRHGRGQQGEIPAWLIEGMAAHLESSSLGQLALDHGFRAVGNRRRVDPVAYIREQLREVGPLTFEQLSWPTEDQLSGHEAELFRNCSHLLVVELLRLKKGPQNMAAMLSLLPKRLNWQFAFLNAYQNHFSSLLEVEKWWTVTTIYFSGSDSFAAWRTAQAWERLDDILLTPVHVRVRADDLPIASHLRLQTVITEWNFAQQLPVLEQKLNHLQALRLRSPTELLRVIDGYQQSLSVYVTKRKGQGAHKTSTVSASGKNAITEILKRLEQLDVQQARVRRETMGTERAALR